MNLDVVRQRIKDSPAHDPSMTVDRAYDEKIPDILRHQVCRRAIRLEGVTGKVGGRLVALGNAKLMADQKVDVASLAAKADELRGSGTTALFVAVDGKPGGMIAIADPIKSTTQAALDRLRSDGNHVVMLTGDNKTTTQSVARQLGNDESKRTCCPRTRIAS